MPAHGLATVSTIEGKLVSPMSPISDGGDLPPRVYQIRIRGRLDAHWSEWLGGLALTYGGPDGGDTILYGPLVDQAALHGVLINLRDLGVTLLAVRCLEPNAADVQCLEPNAADVQ